MACSSHCFSESRTNATQMLPASAPVPTESVHPALAALFPGIQRPNSVASNRSSPVTNTTPMPATNGLKMRGPSNNSARANVPSLLDLIVQGNQRSVAAQQMMMQTRAVDVVSSTLHLQQQLPLDTMLFWPNNAQLNYQQRVAQAAGRKRDMFSTEYVGPQPSSLMQLVDGNMPAALAHLLCAPSPARHYHKPPTTPQRARHALPQSVQRLFDSMSEEQLPPSAVSHNTPQRVHNQNSSTALHHPMGARVIWRSPGSSGSADQTNCNRPTTDNEGSQSNERETQSVKDHVLACLFEKEKGTACADECIVRTQQARDGGELLINRTADGRSKVRVAYDRDTLLRCSRSPFTLMPPAMLLTVCASSELTSALLPKLPTKFDDRQYRMQFDM